MTLRSLIRGGKNENKKNQQISTSFSRSSCRFHGADAFRLCGQQQYILRSGIPGIFRSGLPGIFRSGAPDIFRSRFPDIFRSRVPDVFRFGIICRFPDGFLFGLFFIDILFRGSEGKFGVDGQPYEIPLR